MARRGDISGAAAGADPVGRTHRHDWPVAELGDDLRPGRRHRADDSATATAGRVARAAALAAVWWHRHGAAAPGTGRAGGAGPARRRRGPGAFVVARPV